MSKKTDTIIIIVFVAILFYFIGYAMHFVGKNNVDTAPNITNGIYDIPRDEIEKMLGYPSIHIYYDDVECKIDYPLIDVYFDNDNDWIVLKSDKITSGNPEFSIIRNASSVEYIKDKISVLTFPVGKGTTEDGNISIFKNGVLFKAVPYIEAYISDENLNNLFEKVSRTEIADLLP